MLMPCVIFMDLNDMWQRSGNNVSLAVWMGVWVNIHATCMLLLPVTVSMHAFYPLRTISPVPILAPSVSIVFCLLLMNAFHNNATKWWFSYTLFKTYYEIKSKSKYWFVTLKWKFKSHLKLGRSLRNLDGFFMVFYWTYDEEIFEILNKSSNQNLITGCNEVVAKVMFSQACVILFTGGDVSGRPPWE